MATFAERLLLLREEKHVSQSVAANASGINLRTYHRYENGEREASVSTLIRMADYFGVTIDYLVGRPSFSPRWGNVWQRPSRLPGYGWSTRLSCPTMSICS